MKKVILICLCTISLCFRFFGQESKWTSSRPDGHAPAGVMLDHYHHKGEVMFSYRYMPMFMNGILEGSNELSDDDVYGLMYMSSPQVMQMQMHMLGVMYAPSDRITLMLMGNYLDNHMDLSTMMGMDFSTQSSGLGDISTGALIKIINHKKQSVHVNFGLSLPTGNIDQRGSTPSMEDIQLAYPMQLGSGTVDLKTGTTYLGQIDRISWGVQGLYTYRLGENAFAYTLGNKLIANTWAAFRLNDLFSLSTSTSYENHGSIEGTSSEIVMPGSMMPMMMPLFNTANSGKQIINLGVGFNLYLSKGSLKNLRFGAEVKIPVWQRVVGIQMNQTISACASIQYTL